MVRTTHSQAGDPRTAAEDLRRELMAPGTELVIVFCSAAFDLETLGKEIAGAFDGVTVIGCTTAGEIGPAGYQREGITGVALPTAHYRAVVGRIDGLSDSAASRGRAEAERLLRLFEDQGVAADPSLCFAFLLADGMSVREEPLAWAVQNALGRIPMLGGSAGDDLRFERTWVYHAGRFVTDGAVLALIRSEAPFKIFKTQHFEPSETKLVVTEATPETRTVHEINGLPAGREYARQVGLDVDALTPMIFAAHPVVVKIGDSDYVRSIQKVNPDGSLTFYCAIDEGIVLTIARGIDMVQDLKATFDDIRADIGTPELTLSCDCILRRLELAQGGPRAEVEALLKANNAVGFSTYGEQFKGMHVNQTLTGVALGAPVSEGTADE